MKQRTFSFHESLQYIAVCGVVGMLLTGINILLFLLVYIIGMVALYKAPSAKPGTFYHPKQSKALISLTLEGVILGACLAMFAMTMSIIMLGVLIYFLVMAYYRAKKLEVNIEY